uniref:F-box domain-containing protein n=1 Tax=Globodera pallida TaxID=36090 RepID=A0A183C2T2_GLOPA
MRLMQVNRGSSTGRGIKHMNKMQHSSHSSKKRKLHKNEDDHQQEGCSNETEARKPVVGINDLPHPVLGIILSNLSPVERLRAESVCHRWKFVGVNFGWANQRELSVKEMLHSSVMHSMINLSKPLTNKHSLITPDKLNPIQRIS